MKFQPITVVILLLLSFIACNKDKKIVPESVIYLDMPDSGYTMKVYDTLYISPQITYDDNSSYEWKQDGEVISNERDLTLISDGLNLYEYQFTVENDRGSDTMDIQVQSYFISDFEDLELEDDTFWIAPNGEESFTSDLLTYTVNGTPGSKTDWYGFTYSNLTGNQSSTSKRLSYYSAYKAPSDYTSTNYCILKQDSSMSASYIKLPEGVEHLFESITLNTSYGTYQAVKYGVYGNDTCKVFGGDDGYDKDYLALNITGIKADGSKTDTYSLLLADYRYENNRENYIISSWSEYDIQDIGFVNQLELTIISTDIENGYLQTPAYICIDELKIIE